MTNILFVVPCLQALEEWSGDLSIAKQTYHFEFKTTIKAEKKETLSILNNHNELHRINSNVVHSEGLKNTEGNRPQRIVRVKRCLLGYCFRLLFHEEIHEKLSSITAKIIPGKSSFLAGEIVWEVVEKREGYCEISVHGFHTPNFWIPPFIGEIILKQVFLHEMRETASRLEKLATTRSRESESL
jgi:hypothetical protein